MVKLESFLDSTLFIPNGRFAWYDSHGNIDSSAHVYRGHKASFASYDDSLKPLISVKYQDGNLFEKRDYVQNIYTDSTGNTSDLKEKKRRKMINGFWTALNRKRRRQDLEKTATRNGINISENIYLFLTGLAM
jgi:hypothetical protein